MQPRALSTRARLLEAALERFDALGYLGASVEDLLAAGKVTRGALYYYFGSKEQLAIEALGSFVAELKLGQLTAAVSDSSRSLREHFAMQIDGFEEVGFSRGCLLGVMSLAPEDVAPGLHLAIRQATGEWIAAIASVLTGEGENRSAESRTRAAGAILDAWNGATMRMKMFASAEPLDDFMRITLPALEREHLDARSPVGADLFPGLERKKT